MPLVLLFFFSEGGPRSVYRTAYFLEWSSHCSSPSLLSFLLEMKRKRDEKEEGEKGSLSILHHHHYHHHFVCGFNFQVVPPSLFPPSLPATRKPLSPSRERRRKMESIFPSFPFIVVRRRLWKSTYAPHPPSSPPFSRGFLFLLPFSFSSVALAPRSVSLPHLSLSPLLTSPPPDRNVSGSRKETIH